MKHYFPSRKSVILGLTIWGILLASVGLSNYYMLKDFDQTAFIIVTLVWIPTFLLIGVVWFRTGYIVDNNTLFVKIGPFTEREIDIGGILFIKKEFSVISSPATSFKRLNIGYNTGEILISPAREDEFLSLITELNPKVRVHLCYNFEELNF